MDATTKQTDEHCVLCFRTAELSCSLRDQVKAEDVYPAPAESQVSPCISC